MYTFYVNHNTIRASCIIAKTRTLKLSKPHALTMNIPAAFNQFKALILHEYWWGWWWWLALRQRSHDSNLKVREHWVIYLWYQIIANQRHLCEKILKGLWGLMGTTPACIRKLLMYINYQEILIISKAFHYTMIYPLQVPYSLSGAYSLTSLRNYEIGVWHLFCVIITGFRGKETYIQIVAEVLSYKMRVSHRTLGNKLIDLFPMKRKAFDLTSLLNFHRE